MKATSFSLFDEAKINPKEYIDDIITIAEKFDVDFWKVVRINCSDFVLKRLSKRVA